MKTRLYSLSSQEWPEVFEASQTALREKQMLLYSTDTEIQEVLVQVGWAGEITSETADALVVVDANLASLKSDPAVERSVAYELFQNASDQWLGRVSIRYTHNGSFDWKTTRYRTYTRVYLPVGTELLSVDGSLAQRQDPEPDTGHGTS